MNSLKGRWMRMWMEVGRARYAEDVVRLCRHYWRGRCREEEGWLVRWRGNMPGRVRWGGGGSWVRVRQDKSPRARSCVSKCGRGEERIWKGTEREKKKTSVGPGNPLIGGGGGFFNYFFFILTLCVCIVFVNLWFLFFLCLLVRACFDWFYFSCLRLFLAFVWICLTVHLFQIFCLCVCFWECVLFLLFVFSLTFFVSICMFVAMFFALVSVCSLFFVLNTFSWRFYFFFI